MHTLEENTMTEGCTTVLIDRAATEDKTKGILIVKNDHELKYDSGDDHLEAATQHLKTPGAWNYQSYFLSEATPTTAVLVIVIHKNIGAMQTAMLNDMVLGSREGGLLVNKKCQEPFTIQPKIIVEVEELSELAESILCQTFEVHRL